MSALFSFVFHEGSDSFLEDVSTTINVCCQLVLCENKTVVLNLEVCQLRVPKKKIKHNAVNKWEHLKMRELNTDKRKIFSNEFLCSWLSCILRFKTKFYLL